MYSSQPFDLETFLLLAPDWQGRTYYFPTISSTNQEGRTRLNPPDGPSELLLTTDKQTAGRGRLNRTWEAPFATGLLCTLTLPLAPLPLDRAYLYVCALALSLKKAVRLETELELSLKWPNDLLREGRKCGGILAEIEQGLGPNQAQTWLVLGFGLNTSLTERDLTEAGLADKATNLTPPNRPPVSREPLLAASLSAFATYRQQLTTDPQAVWQEWAAQLITLGQPVQVLNVSGQSGEPVLKGIATGVDPSGGLLVRDESGQTRLVQAGDVSVRLADGRYA